jgi:hypothetical protein
VQLVPTTNACRLHPSLVYGHWYGKVEKGGICTEGKGTRHMGAVCTMAEVHHVMVSTPSHFVNDHDACPKLTSTAPWPRVNWANTPLAVAAGALLPWGAGR